MIDGLGDVLGFALETPAGVPYSLIAPSGDDSAWTVLGHTVADLAAIMSELDVGERGFAWRAKTDPTKPWAVIKVDAAGNRVIVQQIGRASCRERV